MSVRYLAGVLKVFGVCSEGVWNMSGRYQNLVWPKEEHQAELECGPAQPNMFINFHQKNNFCHKNQKYFNSNLYKKYFF